MADHSIDRSGAHANGDLPLLSPIWQIGAMVLALKGDFTPSRAVSVDRSTNLLLKRACVRAVVMKPLAAASL